MLPDIGSCPICKEVCKQFINMLSKKANSVFKPNIYDESEDEDDETDVHVLKVDECEDADDDVIIVEAGNGGPVDSLNNSI